MELSVSQLNDTIKLLLESATFLQELTIVGEISNLTKHSSGHFYFDLKDNDAQVKCVMFRSQAVTVSSSLTNGMQVKAKCGVKVYSPRGVYQLQVDSLKIDGLGDLYLRFLALKDKLQNEGLFDQLAKKQIPQFPKTIGVVTSPTGAVIQDIITTVRKRFPSAKILVSPTQVQGFDASPKIIDAFNMLQKNAEVDVIIIARGGGSIEDLWPFNDETLARTVYKSKKPVVSAIGHETDFTILDFVSDKRAATPTAAAEICTPDSEAILGWLKDQSVSLSKNISNQLSFFEQLLDDYQTRTTQSVEYWLESRNNILDILEAKLQVHDVNFMLDKGYSITTLDTVIIKKPDQVRVGEKVKTRVSGGEFYSVKTDG